MTLMIITITAIAGLLFYLKKKADEIEQNLNEKINKVGEVIDHPEEAVMKAGSSPIKNLFNRFSKSTT